MNTGFFRYRRPLAAPLALGFLASCLATSLARADAIVTVAPATITGNAVACGPCGGADEGSASQGEPGGVPLSQFGVNYNITSFDPALQQTGVNTPGQLTVTVGDGALGGSMSATATNSFTANGPGGPSFTASVTGGTTTANPAYYSQGGVNTGTAFDYYFEVIDPTNPTSTASTTVYVTSTGSINLTTTAAAFSTTDSNTGQALAELLLTSGPGNTTLEELVQTSISYSTTSGGSANPTLLGSDTSLTTTEGPTSTAVGGFTLDDFPVTLDLDTQYEVELSVSVTGGQNLVDGTASVDPIITPESNDQIFFSAGIGDGTTSAVPEPSTWMLMLTGLAALGFVLRRQKSRASTLAECASCVGA
jgi:hypothetical protein